VNTVGAVIQFKYPAGLPLKASQYVRQLATRGSVPSRELTQYVLVPVAMVLLSKVAQAFIQKSRGETGSDGIRWKPLSPKTIAARRTTRAEKKALGMTGRRTRGNLTPAQDRRFKDIFGTRLARFLATGMVAAAVRRDRPQMTHCRVMRTPAFRDAQSAGSPRGCGP
jgi:hypothetical protein